MIGGCVVAIAGYVMLVSCATDESKIPANNSSSRPRQHQFAMEAAFWWLPESSLVVRSESQPLPRFGSLTKVPDGDGLAVQ